MNDIFYRIALRIYKWACIHKIPFPTNPQVEKDLKALHPGENHRQICTEYYVRKMAKTLMICTVTLVLGVVLWVQSKGNTVISGSGEIVRGGYAEEPQKVELECVSDEGVWQFQLEIGAQVYNEAEISTLYKDFCVKLPDYILGENISLERVTADLELLDCYEGYPFAVEWESSCPNLIEADGTVKRGEEPQGVELLAIISYGEWEWEQKYTVRVEAVALNVEEKLQRELEELLLESEQGSRREKSWKLPESWQGRQLEWRERKEKNTWAVAAGGMLVSVLVYLLADKDLHDNVRMRKRQMKRAYPDVVHKLTLYLSAGMTIRWSFQKMAEDYNVKRKEGGKEAPIYEEIVHTCRELAAGVSEGAAYEHLGRNTGLQEYIRLSTLLSQNLKKGNSTLLQRLREEAEKASLERIQYSKRLGEEAVTWLLLPMVLMLLVVMLMIMIPAFSSMGT